MNKYNLFTTTDANIHENMLLICYFLRPSFIMFYLFSYKFKSELDAVYIAFSYPSILTILVLKYN